jgi:hypothetical protein
MALLVVGAEFVPSSPLELELPLMAYYEPDFSIGGMMDRATVLSHEPIKIGYYSWAVWGALAVINCSYNADKFYYEYMM